MQKTIPMFALGLQLLCASYVSLAQSGNIPGKERPIVTCRVWTEVQGFSGDKLVLMHVSIEDNTDQDVMVTGFEVRLDPLAGTKRDAPSENSHSYLSWVDPETRLSLNISLDSQGQLQYPRKKLTVRAGKTAEFTLDLTKLKWTDELSSIAPPTGSLYGIVREGTYEISVVLNGKNANGRWTIRSNKRTIRIHTGPK